MMTSAPSLATPTAGHPALDDPLLLSPFTRWIGLSDDGAAGPRSAAAAESQFQLSGLHCAACASIIERALLALPGVQAATVNSASARLKLRWRPQQLSLAEVLACV